MEKPDYITANEMREKSLTQGCNMVAEEITEGYKAIEAGVVNGYKKIEDGVVGAYKKVEDSFVEKFLTHEGETTEAAKKRLAAQQAARVEESKNSASR